MAANVISLRDFRARRNPLSVAVERLDAMIARLEPLVRDRRGRLTPTIEKELVLIAHAVSAGLPRDAADRAQRLVDLLEHPAALG
jgi:hypothetical protein